MSSSKGTYLHVSLLDLEGRFYIPKRSIQYNKLLIFCLKDTEYVMNIMAFLMTLDDLERGNTKRNYKGRDAESLVKSVKCW